MIITARVLDSRTLLTASGEGAKVRKRGAGLEVVRGGAPAAPPALSPLLALAFLGPSENWPGSRRLLKILRRWKSKTVKEMLEQRREQRAKVEGQSRGGLIMGLPRMMCL